MEFAILGPLSVRSDGEEIRVNGVKQRALLARLLVDANRTVTADRLIEDLWEGSPPRSAASTLQSHVSHLRRVVGGRLRAAGAAYVLDVRGDVVDAAEFEVDAAEGRRLLAAGDSAGAVEVLDRAVGRWRGPVLADVAGAAWARVEAVRLEEARLAALELLFDVRLANGDHEQVVGRVEAAVVEHPLRERLWAQLMLGLYRCGRQADALRAYQGVRALLADELGIEPGPGLVDLEHRILQHDPALLLPPAPATTAMTRPPAAVTSLPTGVVTFLLTDVVGSTRMWELAPDSMVHVLARHDAIIRQSVDLHGGVLLKARGEGDSTFSVYHRATDALAAARTASLALRGEPWPDDLPLRVRMALHTGEALERDGDYYGRTVNRVARLRAIGGAGEVLMTQATAELVVDHLPEGCALVARGAHDLADLSRPETVYELAYDAVPGAATPAADRADPPPAGVPLPSRLARSPVAGFHGRRRELDVLTAALASAIDDADPRFVLVAGEAGIGKTTLAGELARTAHASGANVLYGRCEDGLRVPHRPWAEALGHLLTHASDDVIERVGASRLSHLVRLAPHAAERVGRSPSAAGDAETDRWLLFDAVSGAIAAAATTGPIVVVLEDLHWCDSGTALLLRHVVETVTSGPVLVVALYRDTDLPHGHPLGDVLAALRREPGVERLTLGGMSDGELVALFEALSGQRLHGGELELTRAVHRETGGNPFFSWEIMLHLVESGAVVRGADGRWSSGEALRIELPASVRDVVVRRVARLGEETHRALGVASVIGAEFDLDVLAAATGVTDDRLLDLLEAAEAAGLVSTAANGQFVFSHALIGDSLSTDLSTTRRSRIHLAVAEATERLRPAETAVLARHWAATGRPDDLDRASRHAARAGDEARAALSPHEAVRWYRRALELADASPVADGARRCDLLVRLGRSERDAGDRASRETLLEAAALARRIGADDQLVRAALANNRGYTSVMGLVDADRVDVLEAALQAVGANESAVRARLLAVLAAEVRFADATRSRALAEEAVAVARRLGDERALAYVLNLAFVPLTAPDTIELRRAYAQEAAAIAARVDDPRLAHWAETWLLITAFETGDIDDAQEGVSRLAELATRAALPALAWTHLQYGAAIALLRGDADAADALSSDARRAMDDAGMPETVTLRASVWNAIAEHRGRLVTDHVLEEVDASNASWASPDFRSWWVMVALARGDHVEARRWFDVASAHVDMESWWLGSTSQMAVLALALGDIPEARRRYEALLPWSDRVAFSGVTVNGSVAYALGVVAAALGRADEAERHFDTADRVNGRLRAPFHQARTWIAWARLLLDRRGDGDVERAVELLERARTTSAAHGCAGLEREAAQLLASPATQPGPPALPSRLVTARPVSFVGRSAELDVIARRFKDAANGERGVVLVAGEPGIGKTALIAEAMRAAHAVGAIVLYGRCDEELGLPYQVWAEALGHLVRRVPGIIDALPARAIAALARLAPELADRVAVTPSDPETERWALFEAATSALREASSIAPVVVVVDDVHAADRGSLLLLRHVLAAGVRPLVVVIAYRDSELGAGDPVTETLATIRREPGVDRVVLRGLDDVDIVALLEDAAGSPVDEAGVALAHAVRRETEGNPFFATELLRHIGETGVVDDGDLPDSVREVVGQRVARLGEATVGALTIASVIGRDFDLDLLAAAMGSGEDAVLEAVERAEAAGLLTSDRPGRFSFVHALVAHTVYAAITPTRRARAHRRVAEALESLDAAGTRAPETARHWAKASAPAADRAVDAAQRAGDHMMRSLTPHDAVAWYAQAIDLLEQAGGGDDGRRCELLIRLGRSQRQAADPSYRRTLLDAAAVARRAGDGERLVRAAMANTRGYFSVLGRVDDERVDVLEAALRAPAGQHPPARARLLATLAAETVFAGDVARCRALADEAVALARRVGDPAALLRVLALRYTVTWSPALLADRLKDTAEMGAIAEQLADPVSAQWAASWRFLVLTEAGDIDGAASCLERMQIFLEVGGQPALAWTHTNYGASFAIGRGDLARGERLGEEARRLADAAGQPDAAIMGPGTLDVVRWIRDEIGGSDIALLERAVHDFPEAVTFASYALGLLAVGRSAEAASLLESWLARDFGLPYDLWLLSRLTMWADVAVELRHRTAAERLYELLGPWHAATTYSVNSFHSVVAHHLGLLAAALGRDDDADAHFAAAEVAHERMRAPIAVARTLLEWGRMLLHGRAAGDAERAVGLLERASALAAAHGAWRFHRQAETALADASAG